MGPGTSDETCGIDRFARTSGSLAFLSQPTPGYIRGESPAIGFYYHLLTTQAACDSGLSAHFRSSMSSLIRATIPYWD